MTDYATKPRARTAVDHALAFDAERMNFYPAIDAFEEKCGFRIDVDRLEAMARVLACPVKAKLPSWQHGRVLYALARAIINSSAGPFTFVDIGTAKGFSACCMAWALHDGARPGKVLSYDVIDPESREPRNAPTDFSAIVPTAVELVDRFKPRNVPILLRGGNARPTEEPRVHFAFVDGKHNHTSVLNDAVSIAPRQKSGDVIVFDDFQIEGVAAAVGEFVGSHDESRPIYTPEHIIAAPDRQYFIARRA